MRLIPDDRRRACAGRYLRAVRRRVFADLRRAARHQSQSRRPGADRRLYGAGLLHLLHIDPLLTMPLAMIVLFVVGYVYQRWLIQRAVDQSATWFHAADIRRRADAAERADLGVFAGHAEHHAEPMRSVRCGLAGWCLSGAGQRAAGDQSAAAVGCLALLLKFSALGRVIRATAQQTLAARLCGINVRARLRADVRRLGGVRRCGGHRHRYHAAVLAVGRSRCGR